MSNNASFFKGIEDSHASRDRDHFRAGRYLTVVDAFKVKQNDDGLVFFIFELTVLAVLDDSEALKTPEPAHSIGHKVSWVMGRHKKPTLPNLKQALMVLTGVPEADITPEFCADLSSELNPLRGIPAEFSNKQIKTQNGAPFTQIRAKRRWSAAEVEEKVGKTMLDQLKVKIEDL